MQQQLDAGVHRKAEVATALTMAREEPSLVGIFGTVVMEASHYYCKERVHTSRAITVYNIDFSSSDD